MENEIIRGGQFIVKNTKCEDIFTPEDFTEEQKMMKDAVMEFNEREIIPLKGLLFWKGKHITKWAVFECPIIELYPEVLYFKLM